MLRVGPFVDNSNAGRDWAEHGFDCVMATFRLSHTKASQAPISDVPVSYSRRNIFRGYET